MELIPSLMLGRTLVFSLTVFIFLSRDSIVLDLSCSDTTKAHVFSLTALMVVSTLAMSSAIEAMLVF